MALLQRSNGGANHGMSDSIHPTSRTRCSQYGNGRAALGGLLYFNQRCTTRVSLQYQYLDLHHSISGSVHTLGPTPLRLPP